MADVTDVFISYSRKDILFTQQFNTGLESAGKKSWVDWDDIPLSTDWWNEIREGIEKADAFLCVMTPSSLSSHVCHAEIAYAFARSKRVVPILLIAINEQEVFDTLANAPLDENASSRLGGHDLMDVAHENWRRLKLINWANFEDHDKFTTQLEKLRQILDIDFDHVRSHTQILVRALQWEPDKKNVSILMRGNELQKAEIWLAAAISKEPAPSSLHQAYVAASRTAQRQRQRVQFSAVSIALVIMTVLAIVALILSRIAQNNADLADRRAAESYSLSMAANAQQALDAGNIDLALPLALEAESIDNAPARAHQVLTAAAYSLGTRYKLEGHTLRVNGVAYSPDGNSIATGGYDRFLIIWDAHTGQERIRMQFESPIVALSYLHDNQHILVALFEYSVLVDIQTQTIERGFMGHQQLIIAFAVDPSGSVMATSDQLGSTILWDIASGAQRATLQTTTSRITSLSLNADGKQLLGGSENGILTLWDAATGKEIRHWQASTNSINAVRFSPDGKSALSTGFGNDLVYWNIQTGEARWRRAAGSPANANFCIVFSPDGRFAVAGGNDETMQIWEVEGGNLMTTMAGHSGWISSADFSPDGKFIVTGAWDATARVWQVASFNELTRIDTNYTPSKSVVTPDGKFVLVGTATGTILDVDLQSGKIVQQFIGHTDKVLSLDVSRDGQYVISGGNDGSLRWWDRHTGKELNRYDVEKGYIIITVALTSDAKQAIFFTCDYAGLMVVCNGKVWNTEKWQALRDLQNTGLDEVQAVRISPDDKYIAGTFIGLGTPGETNQLYNIDGGIALWDISTGVQSKRIIGHNDFVYNLVFSPDGQSLLTVSKDRTAALWDASTLNLIRRFEGHLDYIYTADFSPDGQYIITAGRDAQIMLWDRTLGTKVMGFIGHTDAIIDIAFSADSQHLVSVSHDGTVRTWQMPLVGQALIAWTIAHHYIRELSCIEREQYITLSKCNDSGQAPTRTPWLGLPYEGTPLSTFSPATAAVVQAPSLAPITSTPTPTQVIFPTVTSRSTISDEAIASNLSKLNFVPYVSYGTSHWQLTDILVVNAKDMFPNGNGEVITGKVLGLTYRNSLQSVAVVQYETSFADTHELALKKMSVDRAIPGFAEYFPLHGVDILDLNSKAVNQQVTRYFIFVSNHVEVNVISDEAEIDTDLAKELLSALLTEKVTITQVTPLPTVGFQFPPSPTFPPKK